MSLESLYYKFAEWLDPNSVHYKLKPDAPEEAKKAFEEYFKIKKDTAERIIE